MSSIRKRCGNWQVQIRRTGQKTLSRTFDRKTDAVAWARLKDAEIEQSEQPEAVIELSTTTLGELIERYRDTVTPTKKSARQEAYRLNRLLRDPVAKLTLDRMTTGVFARFRDERLKTVGNQQVRHDLNAFAIVMRTARLDWDVPLKEIPLDNIRRPKMPVGRTRRLGDDEYDRLRRAALDGPTPYIWPVIDFAIETAMRQAEILGLVWKHVDMVNRIAHLPDTKNGLPRDVPLTRAAVGILVEQRNSNLKAPFPHTTRMVQWAWRQTVKRANIENLHFHDLRHEGISRLFEKGLNIPEVAVVSGHQDFRMLARYTHLKAKDVCRKID